MSAELAKAIGEFGFPIIAAFGLGYFVYYVWKWVTEEIKPVLGEASGTLIKLIDRIRMLDNDMIRLTQKLNMVLDLQRAEKERQLLEDAKEADKKSKGSQNGKV
jgi:hypothetical protein